MTDTDALLATVREALDELCQDSLESPLSLVLAGQAEGEIDAIFHRAAAALDSLAAELERVKAEKASQVELSLVAVSRLGLAEARLDKALQVIREAGEHAASPGYMRERLAEIEGES